MKYVSFPEVVWFQEGPGVRNTQYTQSGVKLLNVANLVDGMVDTSNTNRHIAEQEAYGKYKHFLVDDGDLIIASSGIKVEYFDKKMGFVDQSQLPLCMNTSTIRFKVLNQNVLDIRYFMYFLKSEQFKQQLTREITGSAQLNFGPSHLKKMQLPLIELSGQLKIVAVLDKVSDLIAKRRQQLDKLDLLVKSKFVEMFGDPVENPMQWKTYQLSKLGSCKNGMNFHAGDSGVELNCLGVGDFKSLAIIDDTSALPKVSLNEEPPKEYLLQNGDIVFVRSNGNKMLVGRCLAVYPEHIKTTFSGFCIRYRLESNEVDRMYLLHLLKTTSARQKLVGRGANIQNLNQKILGELAIPVPPIELQDKFATFIKQAHKSKLTIQQSLEKLETLKKALMQEYFG